MDPNKINKNKRKFIDVSDWFKNYVNKKSVRCKDRFQKIEHPLVSSGKAFWVNNNTLCIIDK